MRVENVVDERVYSYDVERSFYPEGVLAISRWLSAKRDTTGFEFQMNMHPGGMTAAGVKPSVIPPG